MGNLKHYEDVIQQIPVITTGLLTESGLKEQNEKIAEFKNIMAASKYIKVPLVGTFSAGKSSLLNVFLNKPGLLAIDNLPQTAIAYELYYDTNERVEQYRDDKKIAEKPLAEMESLSVEPGDVAYVYVNSDVVKQLNDRGIVVVDMPGIGSGFEKHEQAVMHYIKEGTSFILIVDVEQGTLRTSTLNFLEELSKYNFKTAVLIAKTDKKPAEEVAQIKEEVEYTVKKVCGNDVFVSTVCAAKGDAKGLEDYLNSLDADALMEKRVGMFLPPVIAAIVSQLKTRVEIRTQDITDVDSKIAEIDKAISNVKIDDVIDNSNADTPEKSTNDIMERIREKLIEKSEDIARMIVEKESTDDIKAVILGIVRSELYLSIKDETAQYSEALKGPVDEALAMAFSNVDVDTDIEFGEVFDVVMEIVSVFFKVSGPFALLLSILIDNLGPILNWLFGKDTAELIMEAKDKFINQCASKIVDDMRPHVLNAVTTYQRNIRESMEKEIRNKAESMKAALLEKKSDAQKSKDEVTKEISNLKEAISKLEELK